MDNPVQTEIQVLIPNHIWKRWEKMGARMDQVQIKAFIPAKTPGECNEEISAWVVPWVEPPAHPPTSASTVCANCGTSHRLDEKCAEPPRTVNIKYTNVSNDPSPALEQFKWEGNEPGNTRDNVEELTGNVVAMGKRLAAVDEKFEGLNGRCDALNGLYEGLRERLAAIESHFKEVEMMKEIYDMQRGVKNVPSCRMKLTDISTTKLRRIIRNTERLAGPNSVEVRILRRELERRRAREGDDQISTRVLDGKSYRVVNELDGKPLCSRCAHYHNRSKECSFGKHWSHGVIEATKREAKPKSSAEIVVELLEFQESAIKSPSLISLARITVAKLLWSARFLKRFSVKCERPSGDVYAVGDPQATPPERKVGG